MSAVEYDLHGIVGIRLVDAGEADVGAVDRQLGPIRATLARPPDLTIRFVDDVPPGEVMYVAMDESGRRGDAFVVLRSKHKVPAHVSLPLDRIGQPDAEIVVRRGAPAVPMLIACVNLVALGNGALPLHAAAFVDDGLGILVTGWSKGGKTEALLAFASRGAEYVGDEWVYVLPGATMMAGIPEPIRIWDWQLDQLPELRARIDMADRGRIRAVRATLGLGRAAGRLRSGAVADLLERQRCVDVPPRRLFGREPGSEAVPIDRVCFIGSHQSPVTELVSVSNDEIARRMVWSLRYEQLPLESLYHEFRYAFPGRRNELIDAAPVLQERRLRQAMGGLRSFSVRHPYPVDLGELRRVMRAGIANS